MSQQPFLKVPQKMQNIFNEIVTLTDEYCQEHIDQEYALLIRQIVAALARKRLSPLMQGRASSWACAAVHAAGITNFLFDKSFEPYLPAARLSEDFHLGKSTVSNKSRQIREALKMSQFDHRWMVRSRIKESPMAWMISVNGFIVDARDLPLDVQQIAAAKGLIPAIDN